jgi:hypothetical protein
VHDPVNIYAALLCPVDHYEAKSMSIEIKEEARRVSGIVSTRWLRGVRGGSC